MSSEQTEGALGGLSSEPKPYKQPTRVGKYRVDGVIGRGAVGIVYRGHDEQIDRPLAIKTLRHDVLENVADRDNLLQRFAAEARSAGRCLHPNIVTVFDYAEQDGSPYIVMEHVDAGTLENVISSGTMLPIRQVGEIMGQLLFALDHAHSKGVVHRDVKPANILCPSATTIKVTDFGVARFDSLGLTNPNGIGAIGTPNYMSPEQFLGRPVDGRADLFSAGVILFQLLTGAKPFIANDIAELMRKLLNESPPHIATLRPGNWEQLNTVVQRALARNPDDRFQNANEFIDALNEAIEVTGNDNSPPLDLTKISTAAAIAPGSTSSGNATVPTTNDIDKADLSQTMSAKLMPATLGAVEAALAKSIGPIARVVVRKASLQATDPDMLLTSLSDQIPTESEASKFRKEAEQSIRSDQGVAAVHLDALISTADVQAASDALVPLVGPVAGVLAKRLAQTAIGHEDFHRRLADSIPDENQRAAFLAKMKTQTPGAS
ncbi:MAG: serine/threonine protein kinase [Hyphomicrobiaceae bacterium]|jgi:serine/threonine protein kinase